ncbi:MAG: O-antigen ligase family protein [Deferribacteres bacterium]|nr:O-antigen ligase family protein [candidate division KSB1 bacterium]MCB9501467.1 O-antigen ligase family protein [Deferribacteres bacterium]
MFSLPQTFEISTFTGEISKQHQKDWLYLAPVAAVLAFVLFQLIFFSNYLDIDLGDITPTDKLDIQQGGNIFRQLVMSLAMVFSFIGLIVQIKQKQYRRVNMALMIPFVVYCFASIAWSPVPFITLKRCIQILGLLAIALYAVQAQNHNEKILQIIRTVLAAVVLTNLFVIILFPGIGITPGTHEWRGYLQHKNSLGAVTILAVAVWLPAIFEKQSLRKKLAVAFLIAITLLLTFMSDSKTALLINFVLIAIWLFIIVPLPFVLKMSLSGAMLVFLFLWFLNFQFASINDFTENIFARSADLTGRTQLWGVVFDEFLSHPYFGVGYNGFWTSQIIESDWVTFQAHNGYLDILNELGVVGATFFFLTLVGLLVRIIRLMLRNPSGFLPYFLLFAGIVLHNFMESNFCRAMTRNWFLYLLIYVIIFAIPFSKSSPRMQERHP